MKWELGSLILVTFFFKSNLILTQFCTVGAWGKVGESKLNYYFSEIIQKQ